MLVCLLAFASTPEMRPWGIREKRFFVGYPRCALLLLGKVQLCLSHGAHHGLKGYATEVFEDLCGSLKHHRVALVFFWLGLSLRS